MIKEKRRINFYTINLEQRYAINIRTLDQFLYGTIN